MNGGAVPGWKMVEGRAVRAFTDQEAAFDLAKAAGVEEALLYERRPITLTALETLMGTGRLPSYLRTGGNPDNTAPGEATVIGVVDHIGEAVTARLALIEQFPGERQKLVLTFRYVNGWDWNEICRRLCYGKSQVFRLHREALVGIARLMKVSS